MHLSTSHKSGKINVILAEQGKSARMTLLRFVATSNAFANTKMFDFVIAVMQPYPAYYVGHPISSDNGLISQKLL